MKKLGKHGGRLILRNIPFSIQEKTLRAWLEKIGPLKELTIPVTPDSKRNRGFAFVEFGKKNLSEKAVKTLNGKLLQNRQVSLDYAQSKEKYETSVKAEEMAKDFKPVIQEDVVEQEVEDNIEIDENKASDEKETQQKNLFLEGRVLFAMNINYMTEDEDLFERFKEFGRLNYAKIVRNKETGESKGTAFICFKKPEVVENVLKISEESGIELDERKLKLVKAVSREAAVNLKTAKPVKDDKRNLHLTKLALISPDSKEFQTLSEKEVQMRTMAAKKMKEKLQNPNIFISPTRLLFRNISKSISEDDLKVLVKKILIDNDPQLANQKLFVQVKVLKETERLDKEGNPLSKGFAFIEFKKHEFALKAIKLCNNDSKYFGGKFKPIVEFSLEDHRVLRIRKIKISRQKKKNLEKIGEKEKKEKKEKIGRGKKQRMKRKLKKETESQVV